MEKLEKKAITKVALGALAGAGLFANVMWGFAPVIDSLNQGHTKEEIESAKVSLRLSYDGYTHNQNDPVISSNSSLLKNITKPGRELGYFAYNIGFR